jgi:hypothetical protein
MHTTATTWTNEFQRITNENAMERTKGSNILFNWTIKRKQLHELINATQGWNITHYQVPATNTPKTKFLQ